MKAPIRRGLFVGARKALFDFALTAVSLQSAAVLPTPLLGGRPGAFFMDEIQQRWLCALSAPMAALNTGAGYDDPAFCDDHYIDLKDSWGSMIGGNCSTCSNG
jgi:hypothetical protein